MRAKFVRVGNVRRFEDAVAALNGRTATEKQIVVVAADPGFGKSRTLAWWTVKSNGVLLLAHRHMTPGHVLGDLLAELGKPVPHTRDKRWKTAIAELATRPRPIVVDEVEDALADSGEAVDELRKLADMVEVPLVLVGKAAVPGQIAQHPQIWRRVGAVCEFQPLDKVDVRDLLDELIGAHADDDLVEPLLDSYHGRIDNTLHYGVGAIDAWAAAHPGEAPCAGAVGELPAALDRPDRTAELIAIGRRRNRWRPARPAAQTKEVA